MCPDTCHLCTQVVPTGRPSPRYQGTVSAPGVVIDTSKGDAVGAGDAFTAAMAHQLVHNATPQEALKAANRYAALVATKEGAMPVVSSDELAGIGF